MLDMHYDTKTQIDHVAVHKRVKHRYECSKWLKKQSDACWRASIRQASGKHHNKIDEEFPSPFCSTYGCSGWITKILIDKQH